MGLIIARYDVILDQSECAHLYNHLSNIIIVMIIIVIVTFDFRVNQPSGETSTLQLLLAQTCTYLEAEVRLLTKLAG